MSRCGASSAPTSSQLSPCLSFHLFLSFSFIPSLTRKVCNTLSYPDAADKDVRRYLASFNRLPPSHKVSLPPPPFFSNTTFLSMHCMCIAGHPRPSPPQVPANPMVHIHQCFFHHRHASGTPCAISLSDHPGPLLISKGFLIV